ncbi:MAG: hypothetical protein WCF16_11485 [Alphaproteobacteria bacterium]
MEEQSAHWDALSAARYREKAIHCRSLALGAISSGVARELESIALEYDGDAEKLER